MSRNVLAIAAVFEAVTGIALIVIPALVARVLLGSDLPPIGVVVARIAGFALLALGCACWPSARVSADWSAVRGLLIYNALVAVFLIYLGARNTFVGVLLWPAAAVQTFLTVLLARVRLQ